MAQRTSGRGHNLIGTSTGTGAVPPERGKLPTGGSHRRTQTHWCPVIQSRKGSPSPPAHRYCLALVVCLLVSGTSRAETLRVAVAANFYPTMNLLAEHFEQRTGHRIQLISGSSGKLAAQLLRGAAADLFLSADAARATYLEKQGLGVPGSRRVYAYGRLALVSRNPEPLQTLLTGNFDRLAMANPGLAPYGLAAEQSLEALDVQINADQRVHGENVSQAFHFFARGGVDLALIARSQLEHPESQKAFVELLPENLHAPLEQHMVLFDAGEAARGLYEFLGGTEAAGIIRSAGYRPPQPGGAP